MSLELPQPVSSVLSIDGTVDGTTVTVRFRGTADAEARADLDAVVSKLHGEVRRLAATTVVIDFRELEFMNSSSFKSFVSWLAVVQEQPPEQQYKIRFLSNPSMHWQRRSLAALSCFAVDLVTIET